MIDRIPPPARREVLVAYRAALAAPGPRPTYDDIAARTGRSRVAIGLAVGHLSRAGWLRKMPHCSRSVTLTPKAERLLDLMGAAR